MITTEQIRNTMTGQCDGPCCRIFPNTEGCQGIRSPEGIPPCYKKPEKKLGLLTRTLKDLEHGLNRTLSPEETAIVRNIVSKLPVRRVPPEALEKIRERNRKEKQFKKELDASERASLSPVGQQFLDTLLDKYGGDRTKFTFADIRAISKLRMKDK